MSVHYYDNRMKLHIQPYIIKKFHQLGLSVNTTIKTPMPTNHRMEDTCDSCDVDPDIRTKFLQYVGILRYSADSVRIDLAYAAHKLATYAKSPNQTHLQIAVKALQYMYNTSHYDSSLSDLPRAKSTIAFIIGTNGPIMWYSAGYCDSVLHSSNASEYVVICKSFMAADFIASVISTVEQRSIE
eukprot:Awhi_evm4s2575